MNETRNPLIFLARLEGFEPPTYGLEVSSLSLTRDTKRH